MVAEIYGVHGSDTKERKWDLIVGSFAGGWVGVHLFCPRFGLHVNVAHFDEQLSRPAHANPLHTLHAGAFFCLQRVFFLCECFCFGKFHKIPKNSEKFHKMPKNS